MYGDPNLDCNGFNVINTADGGYLLAGIQYTTGGSASDALIIKFDANGDTVWTRTYGGPNYELAYTASPAGSGYVIYGGSNSTGLGGTDLFSLTVDANGDTTRTFLYGGTADDDCLAGSGGGVESEGNYIFCGQTRSYGAGLYDAYLMKTDFTGAVLWSRTYGGQFSEQGGSVVRTSDSGFACTGYTTSFGSGVTDVYLLKADSVGNMLWSKCYGLGTSEFGFGVIETSDQGFLITGMRQLSSSDYEMIVIKTDSVGTMLWNKQYGGTGGNEWGSSAIEVATGGYLICGRTGSYGNGNEDMLLVRTDVNGDTLWTRAFGFSANDYAYSVIATPDGGFMVCGGGVGLTGNRDQVYLIKTDANGFTGCNETYAPVTVTSVNFIQMNAPMIQGGGDSTAIPTWQLESGTIIQNFCFGVGVEENEIQSNQADFYPLPAQDYVTIHLPYSERDAKGTCSIYSASGELVEQIVIVSEQTLVDVRKYPAGIYFCILEDTSGGIPLGRFIVQ